MKLKKEIKKPLLVNVIDNIDFEDSDDILNININQEVKYGKYTIKRQNNDNYYFEGDAINNRYINFIGPGYLVTKYSCVKDIDKINLVIPSDDEYIKSVNVANLKLSQIDISTTSHYPYKGDEYSFVLYLRENEKFIFELDIPSKTFSQCIKRLDGAKILNYCDIKGDYNIKGVNEIKDINNKELTTSEELSNVIYDYLFLSTEINEMKIISVLRKENNKIFFEIDRNFPVLFTKYFYHYYYDEMLLNIK